MIRTVIVDDEPIGLKHLVSLIEKYAPRLSIVAAVSSVADAVEAIVASRPQLLLLDIELGGENSFDILEQTQAFHYEKIFVTAHSDFAVQAIRKNAIGYVLKPIDKIELIEAIEKAINKISKADMAGTLQGQAGGSSRIGLPTIDGLIFVDISRIMYCEADGRYTRFYLADKKILVSKNIGEYEAILPAGSFVRIHNHYLVNINYIEQYVKGRGGYIVMANGVSLEVSARKKDGLLEHLGQK